MPPTTPCVLHHYDGPAGPGEGFFICPVGHRFKFKLRTAKQSAERYGRAWILVRCISCAPVSCLYEEGRGDVLEFLTQLAIVPPNAEPRPLYRAPPPPAGTTATP